MLNTLVGHVHKVSVKGMLVGDQGRGKFDLEEFRVDGLPVPTILISPLFDRYVKTNYARADLKDTFELPWGVQQVRIEEGKLIAHY